MTLARFERRLQLSPKEEAHYLWVVGPAGAVSTCFFNTREIIGYSVCDGLVWHFPSCDGQDGSAACEFLESACTFNHDSLAAWYGWEARQTWPRVSSPFRDHPLIVAYDAGDQDFVWRWLEAAYPRLSEQREECG